MTQPADEDLNTEVLNTISNGIRHAYFCCGIELQREHIQNLESLSVRFNSLRDDFVEQSDEPRANAAFRVQKLALGTKNFLEMWVQLKEDHHGKAWDCLIDAQSDFKIAQRIQLDSVTQCLLLHLLAVEQTIFPPQTFFSSAFTYPEAFCSICDQLCGECGHVLGRIYMGQICQRVIPKPSLAEISIVIFPGDKRCRITEYAKEGKVCCTLTHRELSQSASVDPTVEYASGVVYRFD